MKFIKSMSFLIFISCAGSVFSVNQPEILEDVSEFPEDISEFSPENQKIRRKKKETPPPWWQRLKNRRKELLAVTGGLTAAALIAYKLLNKQEAESHAEPAAPVTSGTGTTGSGTKTEQPGIIFELPPDVEVRLQREKPVIPSVTIAPNKEAPLQKYDDKIVSLVNTANEMVKQGNLSAGNLAVLKSALFHLLHFRTIVDGILRQNNAVRKPSDAIMLSQRNMRYIIVFTKFFKAPTDKQLQLDLIEDSITMLLHMGALGQRDSHELKKAIIRFAVCRNELLKELRIAASKPKITKDLGSVTCAHLKEQVKRGGAEKWISFLSENLMPCLSGDHETNKELTIFADCQHAFCSQCVEAIRPDATTGKKLCPFDRKPIGDCWKVTLDVPVTELADKLAEE